MLPFPGKKIGLDLKSYASPAPPLYTSIIEPADNMVLLEVPVGWYGDWHPTPEKQWPILMTGECEFKAGNGEKTIRKADDVVLLDMRRMMRLVKGTR